MGAQITVALPIEEIGLADQYSRYARDAEAPM